MRNGGVIGLDYSAADGYAFCSGSPFLPNDCGAVIDPRKTCCFTGHRSDKLPNGDELEILRERLFVAMLEMIGRGVDTFITGMAEGFDLIAAETVINFYARPCLRLVCAVPYFGQIGEMKTAENRQRYQSLLRAAAYKVCFFERFSPKAYRVRNQFMVNYSSHLIGFMNGNSSRSGTGQTIRMAQRAGLDIRLITPDELIRD